MEMISSMVVSCLDSFNAHCPFYREGHIREEYKSLSATRITLSCFKRIEGRGGRDTVELTGVMRSGRRGGGGGDQRLEICVNRVHLF